MWMEDGNSMQDVFLPEKELLIPCLSTPYQIRIRVTDGHASILWGGSSAEEEKVKCKQCQYI